MEVCFKKVDAGVDIVLVNTDDPYAHASPRFFPLGRRNAGRLLRVLQQLPPVEYIDEGTRETLSIRETPDGYRLGLEHLGVECFLLTADIPEYVRQLREALRP